MDSLNLTHVSIAISVSTLAVLLKLSFQIGRHVEQFNEIKARVRLHDKLLGIPQVAMTESANSNGD